MSFFFSHFFMNNRIIFVHSCCSVSFFYKKRMFGDQVEGHSNNFLAEVGKFLFIGYWKALHVDLIGGENLNFPVHAVLLLVENHMLFGFTPKFLRKKMIEIFFLQICKVLEVIEWDHQSFRSKSWFLGRPVELRKSKLKFNWGTKNWSNKLFLHCLFFFHIFLWTIG